MTADSQALRDLSKQIDAALIDLITGDDDELPALRRAYLNLVGEFHTETKKQVAVRAHADTSTPRTRYQWIGGADGDLFQVEDTETKKQKEQEQ